MRRARARNRLVGPSRSVCQCFGFQARAARSGVESERAFVVFDLNPVPASSLRNSRVIWIGSIAMAQMIVSWSIYDGEIRVHAINAVGRRKGRIIEVEVVDTHERFHGSARRLGRLVQTLQRSRGELDQAPGWTPGRTS